MSARTRSIAAGRPSRRFKPVAKTSQSYLASGFSPVRWAHPWQWRGVVARFIPMRGPAVLVVSLPRSGSSWVGDMLGSAEDALYLREPITQSNAAINRRQVFDPARHPELEPSFRRLADRAFGGIPAFPEKIVRKPHQWSLRSRSQRRVLIKEVNPLCCRYVIERYRPFVVLLTRHPAAVAASAEAQGWLGCRPEDWGQRGAENGMALREAWDMIRDYPHHRVVAFETLCEQPLAEFRQLVAACGLTWSSSLAETIFTYSAESRDRVDAWRSTANPACVAALRAAYLAESAPWYGPDRW